MLRFKSTSSKAKSRLLLFPRSYVLFPFHELSWFQEITEWEKKFMNVRLLGPWLAQIKHYESNDSTVFTITILAGVSITAKLISTRQPFTSTANCRRKVADYGKCPYLIQTGKLQKDSGLNIKENTWRQHDSQKSIWNAVLPVSGTTAVFKARLAALSSPPLALQVNIFSV